MGETPIPLTVIGGFLGAGKTTLLNHVLRAADGVRYAVMVNDFGALAIDELLVSRHEGDTISFANGCVCCALGDNFVAAIDTLLARDPQPEHFLVEASGVANPKAIADVATLHPRLRRDLIIALVDASTVRQRMADPLLADTVVMQLAAADLLVLNKRDLVSAQYLSALRAELEETWPGAVVDTTQAALPAGVLAAQAPVADVATAGPWVHAPEAQFHRAALTLPGAVPCAAVVAVLRQYQPQILRAKGFVCGDDGGIVGIQLSGRRIDITPLVSSPLPSPVLVALAVTPLDDFERALRRLKTED